MQKIKAAFMAAMISLGLLVGVQPASAQPVGFCESGFGTKVPVLMVHGFNSNPRMWREGSEPIQQAIEKIGNAKVVATFDYAKASSEWVTHSAIGPRLAQTIDCLAQASLKGGGKGKVVVIAHSMGGLATRFAANQTVNGRRVADELGLVITIGTPHLGAPIANFGMVGAGNLCNFAATIPVSRQRCVRAPAIMGMQAGSDELKQLPAMPRNVPVKAIAGDVTAHYWILFARITLPTKSDLVVPLASAIDESTDRFAGDGKHIVQCEGDVWFANLSNASCEHNALVHNSSVQKSVKESVRTYIGSPKEARPKLPLPPGNIITLFDRLVITVPDVWDGAMSEPGVIENLTDLADCPTGTGAHCPHIRIVNLAAKEAGQYYPGNPVRAAASKTCMSVSPELPVHELPTLKGEVTVGGVKARYYEQIVCPPYITPQVKNYFWLIDGQKVFVVATGTAYGKVGIKNLRAVLDNAVWK